MLRVPLVIVAVTREFDFILGLEVCEPQSRYDRNLLKVLIFLQCSGIRDIYK